MNIASPDAFADAGSEISTKWNKGISHPLIQKAGFKALLAVQNFFADPNVPVSSKDILGRALNDVDRYMRSHELTPALAWLDKAENAQRYQESLQGKSVERGNHYALHHLFSHLQKVGAAQNNFFHLKAGGKKKETGIALLDENFGAEGASQIKQFLNEKTPGWDSPGTQSGWHHFAFVSLARWLGTNGLTYQAFSKEEAKAFIDGLESDTAKERFNATLGEMYGRFVKAGLVQENPFEVRQRYENMFSLLGQSGKRYEAAVQAFFADKTPRLAARYANGIDHVAKWLLGNGAAEHISEITYHMLLSCKEQGADGHTFETHKTYFSGFTELLRYLEKAGLKAGINNPARKFFKGRKHVRFSETLPFTITRHEARHKTIGQRREYDWGQSIVHLEQAGAKHEMTSHEFLLLIRGRYSAGLIEKLLNNDVSRNAVIGKLNRLKESHGEPAEVPYEAKQRIVPQVSRHSLQNLAPVRAAHAKAAAAKQAKLIRREPAKPACDNHLPSGIGALCEKEVYGPPMPTAMQPVEEAHAFLGDDTASYEDCLMLARFVRHFAVHKTLRPGEALIKHFGGQKRIGQTCWDLADEHGWVDIVNGSPRCSQAFSDMFNHPTGAIRRWADGFVHVHEQEMHRRFSHVLVVDGTLLSPDAARPQAGGAPSPHIRHWHAA